MRRSMRMAIPSVRGPWTKSRNAAYVASPAIYRENRCWACPPSSRSTTACASGPSYTRWNKTLDQILSWGRFKEANFMTDAQIDEWIKTQRPKVTYLDESKLD